MYLKSSRRSHQLCCREQPHYIKHAERIPAFQGTSGNTGRTISSYCNAKCNGNRKKLSICSTAEISKSFASKMIIVKQRKAKKVTYIILFKVHFLLL